MRTWGGSDGVSGIFREAPRAQSLGIDAGADDWRRADVGCIMNWTSEAIATLRRLWADGMPSAQIGKVLHCSKNAIVGKAHRLNLEPRPSPIKAGPRAVKAVRLPRAPVIHCAPTYRRAASATHAAKLPNAPGSKHGPALKLHRNNGNYALPAHPSANSKALLPSAALARVQGRN